DAPVGRFLARAVRHRIERRLADRHRPYKLEPRPQARELADGRWTGFRFLRVVRARRFADRGDPALRLFRGLAQAAQTTDHARFDLALRRYVLPGADGRGYDD